MFFLQTKFKTYRLIKVTNLLVLLRVFTVSYTSDRTYIFFQAEDEPSGGL